MGIAINMRLAEADTAVRQRTIDRYSSREDVQSKRDVVAEIMVGRAGVSDHSERLELVFG